MTVVTIGGVTVGLAVLIRYLVGWWPGRKSLISDPVTHAGKLAPFLAAWAYGVLAILTVGGLIGWAADTALWISNWLGDAALVWGIGAEPGRAAGAQTWLPLTQTGGAVVLLLTVAMATAAKKARCGQEIKLGAWCGICLGTSAGVAGFAAVPLAQAANWAGLHVYGVLA